MMSMNTDGFFGITATTSINFVFYFIMFGAVRATGGGALFIDIAMRRRSHPVAPPRQRLFGSGLFGTISGSAVSNVAATGVLTIPLMRRSGYTAEQAAATEAIASTGGQLMPSRSWHRRLRDGRHVTALRPDRARRHHSGLTFYAALYVIIDLRARNRYRRTVDFDDDRLPLAALHLLIGPLALLGMLFGGFSAPFAFSTTRAIAFGQLLLRKTMARPRQTVEIA